MKPKHKPLHLHKKHMSVTLFLILITPSALFTYVLDKSLPLPRGYEGAWNVATELIRPVFVATLAKCLFTDANGKRVDI